MSAFQPAPVPERLRAREVFPGPMPSPEVLCAQECGREWYIMRRGKAGLWQPTCAACFVRMAQGRQQELGTRAAVGPAPVGVAA